jgi:large subunit ribosomal protein L13
MINKVAGNIRGRGSPHYKASLSQPQHGDMCVIVNIEDPLVTGKKLLFKQLTYHTGFVGHLRQRSYKYVLNHKPELLVFVLITLVSLFVEKSYA